MDASNCITARRVRAVALVLILLSAASAAGCTLIPIRGRHLLRALDGRELCFAAAGSPEFPAALSAALRLPGRDETQVKLLQDGDETYPVMFELIASAKTRISLETYIVGGDDITDRFFQALRDAANRGVEVRLLVDAVGYGRGLIADVSGMNGPNLEARIFNPFFFSWTVIRGNNRNHRKILVVDGEYAVMGGLNLSKEQMGDGISGWRDTALLATGPVAADAERIFSETWAQGGRGWLGKTLPLSFLNPLKLALDEPLLHLREHAFCLPRFTPPPYRPPDSPGVFPDEFYDSTSATVWATGSSPDKWRSVTFDLALASILAARERIDAVYAYFVPPKELREALTAAARRGVKVRLLLPGVTDVRFVREIGLRHYGELLEAGIEIYEWPHEILHAKTMAVDGSLLLVGSANMDGRSYFLNYESVFAVDDVQTAEAAHRQFDRDLLESSRLTLDAWRQRGGKQRALEMVMTPLSGQF